MPDPRYQVFVSSTFLDLREARQQVLEALLDHGCIPAGMELFMASSMEQLNYIKAEIDESDYYVLILGWRYGSVHSDGISYTEREFDYAVSRDIPVLVFAHADQNAVPVDFRESDPDKIARLADLRQKAFAGRTAKLWNTRDELAGRVAFSLSKEFRANPRIGWIRANSGPDAATLARIVELESENRTLRSDLAGAKAAFPKADITALAGFNETTTFRILCSYKSFSNIDSQVATRTWQDIFATIALNLVGTRHEDVVSENLAKSAYAPKPGYGQTNKIWVHTDDLQRIGVQLQAYGLLTVSQQVSTLKVYQVYWALTSAGGEARLKYCSVKTAAPGKQVQGTVPNFS